MKTNELNHPRLSQFQLQSNVSLDDALKLVQDVEINLLENQSSFSLWKPAKDVHRHNVLVSSFTKAYMFPCFGTKINSEDQPLLARRIKKVELAGRGHVQVNGPEGTITKDGLNAVELKFLKEIFDNQMHPLHLFVPEIHEVNTTTQTVTMEDISAGVKDRNTDLLDIKIGRHFANKEELIGHDYQGKCKLAVGYKMLRMGILEKLTGAINRGYTFIPQTKDLKQRQVQGNHSEQQISQRLSLKSTNTLESLTRQLRALKNAIDADHNNTFIASSVLISFPEGGEPKVKLIDFAHRMERDEFVALREFNTTKAQSFEQCRTDFLFGINELLKLSEAKSTTMHQGIKDLV